MFPWVPKIYHLHVQDATERRDGDHGHNSTSQPCSLLVADSPVTCGPISWSCPRGQGLISIPPPPPLRLTVCNSRSAHWDWAGGISVSAADLMVRKVHPRSQSRWGWRDNKANETNPNCEPYVWGNNFTLLWAGKKKAQRFRWLVFGLQFRLQLWALYSQVLLMHLNKYPQISHHPRCPWCEWITDNQMYMQ